eukprot:CAMPEP_0185007318 /NCGR_PEP_ID=MMETSP1098-20130426/86793_1 /TAXON_ID=89044 /ORGANISM="Spumella elongata, Strain CCAP 955/1" /LENGTH=453 /DNA_ID=CAMNT_0027535635 /DNA_START=55 /DNA_END=1416 /DNA_ORIENTATION=-
MKSNNAAEGGPATPHVIYPVDKDTGFAMVSPMAPIRRQSLSATVPTETPSVQSTDNQKKESTQAETVPSTAHVIYPIMKENDFTMESPMPSSRRQSYAEPATASAPAATAPTAEATVPNKRPSMTFLESLGFASKKEECSDPPATSTAHVIYPIVSENSFTMVSPMSSSRRQSHSGSIQPPVVPSEDASIVSNKSTTADTGVAAPHTIYPVEKNADFTMNSPMQSSRNQSHIEDPITVAETTKPNKRPSMSFLETIGFTTVKEKTPDMSNPATAHVIYPAVKDAGFTMESPMASGRRASHTQEVPPAVAATTTPIVSGPTALKPSVTTAEPSFATPKKEPNPQNLIPSAAHVIYPVVKDTSFTMESPMAGTRRASHTAELPAAPVVTPAVPATRPSIKCPEVLQVSLQQDTNPDLLLPTTAHVIYPVVKDTRFAMESPMAGTRRPSHQSTSNA